MLRVKRGHSGEVGGAECVPCTKPRPVCTCGVHVQSFRHLPGAETLALSPAERIELSKQVAQLSDGPSGPQLVSARGVPRSEALLAVPDSLWITSQTVADCSIGPLVQQLPSWLQVRPGQPLMCCAAGCLACTVLLLNARATHCGLLTALKAGPASWGDCILQIALFLLVERAAGDGSPWAGYIQALPQQPQSPMFWSAEERQQLDCTQLLESLEGYE